MVLGLGEGAEKPWGQGIQEELSCEAARVSTVF